MAVVSPDFGKDHHKELVTLFRLVDIETREIELEWSFEDYDLHLDLVLEPATEPEPYTFVYLGFGGHQGLHGTRTLVVR